jgi:multiple sugar transport system substrate-binding protein
MPLIRTGSCQKEKAMMRNTQSRATLPANHAEQPAGRDRAPLRSRPVSRRTFLRAAGALAAGAAVAACTPRSGGLGPHGSDTVQLVYQDWRTEWFPGMAQQMLEQFHADHPNIHVFFAQDPDDVQDSMLADFQAGTAPDVMTGCCDFFPIWAQQGYLLDLRPYVAADLDRATIDDWDRAQMEALFTQDGAQFALPKYHGALALFYNKDLFDASAVDYPDGSWTHDDYAMAMKRLTRRRDRSGQGQVWGSMIDIGWERLQVHANSWGGHFVDPHNSARSLMGAPEAMSAMQWVHDRMWDEHSMASFLDVQNVETRHAFAQQRLAMVEDGSWALKDILENAPFRIGVSPMPSGPAGKATLATTDGFAIYAGTKYPEAAWELLKFLISQDYGRAMARTHLLQPARESLVDEWIGFIVDQFPAKTKELDLAAFAEGHREGYSVTAEIFRNMADARRLAQAAWGEIFTLGQAPVSRIKEVSLQIEAAQGTA